VFVLSAVFFIVIATIRAQPYTPTMPAQLENAHTNAGNLPCGEMCLLGVVIGETRVEDVFDILLAHQWVQRVSTDYSFGMYDSNTGEIEWTWSGSQPVWVDPNLRSTLWSERGVIAYSRVRTRFTLGEAWLALGAPDESRIVGQGELRQSILLYAGVYPDRGVALSFFERCPLRNIWSRPVTLWIYDTTVEDRLFNGETILYPHRLADYCASP
jgi:hypothetical protein